MNDLFLWSFSVLTNKILFEPNTPLVIFFHKIYLATFVENYLTRFFLHQVTWNVYFNQMFMVKN